MKDNIIQIICAAVGAAAGFLFGDISGIFWGLVAFIVIDYITGIMVAVVQKNLSSEIGFKGIFKKVMIILLVSVGHLTDFYVIGSGSAVQSGVTLFFLANEGISILENCGNLGLPIPQKLKTVLSQLKSENEAAAETVENVADSEDK